MSVPTFEQLYVVSDLHMGGKKGFQVFRMGETLANFIRHLKDKKSDSLALVLNGDIVDFLAEKPFRYLDPEGAIRKLERICNDASFSMVWKALADFVDTPGRHLVLNLGNHDVELALPHVQQWLVAHLSHRCDAARGRITMAVDGAGYPCAVGDKQVLCLHGNEEDAWNAVDFKELLDVARALNRRQTPEDWDANAGTRLVIDVMNKIKAEYPFVDLLKPETKAAVPILLALAPQYVGEIHRLLRVLGYRTRDWVRLKAGFLSAEDQVREEGSAEDDALGKLLSECCGERPIGAGSADVDALLDRAYQRVREGHDPTAQEGETSIEVLGVRDAIATWIGNRKKEVVRKTLRWRLDNDRTFDLEYADKTFKRIDKEVSSQVHYLITGHTHLARALQRNHGGRYYYNCGTWIPLIKLTPDQLDDQERFEAEVYDKLAHGSHEALKGLISQRPCAVSVVAESGEVHGQLSLVQEDGTLKPIEDTRFPEG